MIDKYKEAFQEEAREILSDLESALLELNERPEDVELVGRAFRALHTIKGSGTMFGFDDISSFTHHVENAFDEVRNGRLSASEELIRLALGAVDQIKAMLEEASGQGKADGAIAASILSKLRSLTGVPEKTSSGTTASIAAITPASALSALRPSKQAPGKLVPGDLGLGAANALVEEGTRLLREWNIRLFPKPDFLRTGANPVLLFRELRRMGALKLVADTSGVPVLSELNPECCSIAWDMVLTTAAGIDEIRDVFIFVEDSCELTVNPAAAEPPAQAIKSKNLEVEVEDEDRVTPTATAEKVVSDGPRTADRGPAASIRVATAKLDQLVDLVGQLVTVQARLGEIATRSENQDMVGVVEEIDGLTAELRETSMSMRTVPLRSTFERFKRLVYDLGRTLGKQVELTFEGGETELDKTVIDQLGDPLMHLIRNSMDHGIETPERRRAAGKRATATIQLSARHSGAQVLICVSDDGKGIDRAAVRARAIEKGLLAADADLGESELLSLILAPGFSTAREVTDVSGRGVGMDVVRRNVEALRGSVEVSSQPGTGSKVTLRLPLTLAIIDGLLVRVGTARFVMPVANTVECIELTRQDIVNAGGKHIVNIRGEMIPYIRLSEYLQIGGERQEREQIMVAETEDGKFGFVVDQVLGDHQTVIKNLGRLYRSVQFVSGATILGDGSVALILDPHRLVQCVLRSTTTSPNTLARPAPGAQPQGLAQAATGS